MDKYNGILTLWEQQRCAERVAPRRGRPPSHANVNIDQLLAHEDEVNISKTTTVTYGNMLLFIFMSQGYEKSE